MFGIATYVVCMTTFLHFVISNHVSIINKVMMSLWLGVLGYLIYDLVNEFFERVIL